MARLERSEAFLANLLPSRIAARHGLEKIKTIGDAYVAAAGLPDPRPDRAAAAALTQQMDETVKVRIGLHTGPAIARVIGTTKLFYDMRADTVNTASRLESHRAPGRIQVTHATYNALNNAFPCVPRGRVKLKGAVQTWWLVGPAKQASPLAGIPN